MMPDRRISITVRQARDERRHLPDLVAGVTTLSSRWPPKAVDNANHVLRHWSIRCVRAQRGTLGSARCKVTAPGRTRTSNLQIRSLPLYPIELRAHSGTAGQSRPSHGILRADDEGSNRVGQVAGCGAGSRDCTPQNMLVASLESCYTTLVVTDQEDNGVEPASDADAELAETEEEEAPAAEESDESKAEPAAAPVRKPGMPKEPPPFRWKLVGFSHGIPLTLLRCV